MNDLILNANQTFNSWRDLSVNTRVDYVRHLKEVLLQNSYDFAKVITGEMHKPITQAKAEVEKCAWLCDYYAENAEKFLTPKTIETAAFESYVTYEPLGVILGVMPWNFPFWQVFRFAIPTVLAGNTVMVKHASNVPKSAILLQAIFEKAGFPKGVYTNLPIKSNAVALVIAHPFIKAVSLTGSESAGKAVAVEAGKYLKKCVLELGGNNAFIVCEDADLQLALSIAINARMQNNGQSCIAAKRFLVHKKIADKFVALYVEQINQLIIGDPFDPATQVSSLARTDLAEDLDTQVKKSLALGAKLIVGGSRQQSLYYPTILTNVTPEMPVFQEETFGPIVAITTFDTFDEVINLSNQSQFGLGVSIFTTNVENIKKYIPYFEEGAVFINEMVKSDPRLPFGGVKNSGYGRELSKNGMREFVNVKTVYMQ